MLPFDVTLKEWLIAEAVILLIAAPLIWRLL